MVTTIRMPDELHRKLKNMAEVKGMTLNGLVVMVLWDFADMSNKQDGTAATVLSR